MKHFDYSQKEHFIQNITKGVKKTTKSNKIDYFEIAAGFDIETTSAYIDGEKIGLMYLWTFGIGDCIIMGRTWDEFLELTAEVCEELQIDLSTRLIVYVHNLEFEFQFFRKIFTWDKVFSLSDRRVCYAVTNMGIEFRCSAILSGKKLATLAEEFQGFEKLYGDLDYRLARHEETPLTDEEKNYSFRDVEILLLFITREMNNEGSITKIPLTKTGYVRRYVKKMCLSNRHNEQYYQYRKIMSRLTLEVDEYKALKRAFQGGFNHASCFMSDKTLKQVSSYDITSSYPTVICSEKVPMSKGRYVNKPNDNQITKYTTMYCSILNIEIRNLKPKIVYEHILSYSRCLVEGFYTLDNGRIVTADCVKTTVTNIDYNLLKQFYEGDFIVNSLWFYKKDYLPTPIVQSCIDFYQKKTTLKGVKGSEVEYMVMKEMLNSIYGMCVTDFCRDTIIYDTEGWKKTSADIPACVNDENNSKNRFLFYPWGVWVTAYARKNLFTAITTIGVQGDYIYSDTDSVKILNGDRYKDFFEQYNNQIRNKIDICLMNKNIDPEKSRPQNEKGETKQLGVFDYEGTYNRFKTVGAKRYLCEDEKGVLHITVSGVSKEKGVDYLMSTGKDPFTAFTNNLTIPPDYTGKLTHTYIDDSVSFLLTDYLGNSKLCFAPSAIHLEPAPYHLGYERYIEFLKGYRDCIR